MIKRLIVIKNILVLFSSTGLLVSCGKADYGRISLQKDWRIQSSAIIHADAREISSPAFDTSGWYATDVPKTVLAVLVDNHVYPDPYYGDNLKSIPGFKAGRWLSMSPESPFYPTWWYRKSFFVPGKHKGKKMVLHLDGINYKANVWLNGRKIADSSDVTGMFRRFAFDVDRILRPGRENVLAVEVSAPGKIPDITYHTKQIEATTGWDDHNPQPPDLNMGIWQKVYVTMSDDLVLKDPYVVTDLDLPHLDKASLTLSVDAVNKSDRPLKGKIIATIEDIKVSKKISLQPGETKTIRMTSEEFGDLVIHNPRLWWPHPVGPQNLYWLKLDAVVDHHISDSKKVHFGIREVSTYINAEGWRGYKVNGKKILIRGGAWMTSDMMLNLTHRRYEALIRYAREANLNALRSEGFSIRETDEFYDLCDKYGIMVIQQIFGRSIPDEELAVANVKDMILRIRNHPSLVHFLGHDETFPTKSLDSAYRTLIKEYTPERTYQPHSGAFRIEDRYKTGGTRTGTLELWTYATPSHYYTHKEDGAWGFAQSGGIGGVFAPYESVRRMMPEKDLWPVKNETFSFHTVMQGIEYFDLVLQSLDKHYGPSTGIKELLRKGQTLNYASARGMFEAWGRNKYDALGITTWKYDAAWPAALTWQYVDGYLNVGGAYYGAKKACEPLHVQYSYDDRSVYVVNSFYRDFDSLTVTAGIFNFDLKEVYSRNREVSVKSDGKTEAFVINLPEHLSKTYFLRLKLKEATGKVISDNFYWLSTVPDIQGTKKEVLTDKGWGILKTEPVSYADYTQLNELPKVKVDTDYSMVRVGKENRMTVTVENKGNQLAFQLHLALTDGKNGKEILPVYWEDNYFSLFPGESKTLTARFENEDLPAAGPTLKIEGWNIIH